MLIPRFARSKEKLSKQKIQYHKGRLSVRRASSKNQLYMARLNSPRLSNDDLFWSIVGIPIYFALFSLGARLRKTNWRFSVTRFYSWKTECRLAIIKSYSCIRAYFWVIFLKSYYCCFYVSHPMLLILIHVTCTHTLIYGRVTSSLWLSSLCKCLIYGNLTIEAFYLWCFIVELALATWWNRRVRRFIDPLFTSTNLRETNAQSVCYVIFYSGCLR